jgi:hypothetical protein
MKMMKTIVVLGLCVAGLGYYRGWFTLSSHGRDAESNKAEVKLTVDPDKVKEDVGKVKEKTTELGNEARDKVKSDGK